MPRRVRLALLASASLTLVAWAVPAAASAVTAGSPRSLTAVAPVTETFDTLASSSSSATLPPGALFDETGTSANANGQYQAGDGSSNGGDVFSFGATGATERALGELRSGSLAPTLAYALTNNTGQTITSLDVAYTGEQWRLGTAGRTDALDFGYALDAASPTAGTFTDVDVLDFAAPTQGGNVGKLDGNAAANRTARTGTISGLSLAPGLTITLRWSDRDATGSDDGLAIDDLTVTPSAGQPSTNQPPTAANDPYQTAQGKALTVPAPGVLTNDRDPDNGPSRLTAGSAGVPSRGGTVALAADGSFTYTPAAGFSGPETFTYQASDGQAAAQATVTVNVVAPIVPIGAVQGSVGDDVDGATFRSPFAPPTGNGSSTNEVTVQGVIYEKTITSTGSGTPTRGFFVQNTAATADGDPNSADGIFVFTSTFPTLIGGYTPTVGDEVVIRGKVAEFFNLTELTNASLVSVVRSGVVLDAEVPASDYHPPEDVAAVVNRYGERREGVRVALPAAAVAVSPRIPRSDGNLDTYFVHPDSTVAKRTDPYARRVFRDPHPLDNKPETLFDDGNEYRINVGSIGVKGATGDATQNVTSTRVYDTLTTPAVGGVSFTFGRYQLEPDRQLATAAGPSPDQNAPPADPVRPAQYSVADYNVENLYDFRDDPFDSYDFIGNANCTSASTCDYPPRSEAEYRTKLHDIAVQITRDLHSPEILLTQEAEDQDICTVQNAELVCGTTDNADGKPDDLQDLALEIARLGGPAYDAAFDRDGTDQRGIISPILYRTDRVHLVPATDGDAVLGANPGVAYRGAPSAYNTQTSNPKSLNAVLPPDVDTSTGQDGTNVYTRAPQIGRFRLFRDGVASGGPSIELWAISNHFSSGPDRRAGQRREQAAYGAAIYNAIRAAHPGVRVVTAGDFNVYPRPDDPFPPGDPRTPTDQLAPLYDAGLANLFDRLVAEVPTAAYSYTFSGQTQTLDQQFVAPELAADLASFRVAHINADYPQDGSSPGERGVSDHDPGVSLYGFPAAPAVVTPPTVSGTPNEGSTLTAGDGTYRGGAVTGRQWQRCATSDGSGCADIAGATGPTYVVTAADGDRFLRVVVTVTGEGGTTTAPSATVGPAVARPTALAAPTVSGSAREGETLTSTDGTFGGSASTATRQWERCATAAGSGCAPIPGATGVTYRLVTDDVGRFVRVVVTATNAAGSASQASATAGPITKKNGKPPKPKPRPHVLRAVKIAVTGGLTPRAERLELRLTNRNRFAVRAVTSAAWRSGRTVIGRAGPRGTALAPRKRATVSLRVPKAVRRTAARGRRVAVTITVRLSARSRSPRVIRIAVPLSRAHAAHPR